MCPDCMLGGQTFVRSTVRRPFAVSDDRACGNRGSRAPPAGDGNYGSAEYSARLAESGRKRLFFTSWNCATIGRGGQ